MKHIAKQGSICVTMIVWCYFPNIFLLFYPTQLHICIYYTDLINVLIVVLAHTEMILLMGVASVIKGVLPKRMKIVSYTIICSWDEYFLKHLRHLWKFVEANLSILWKPRELLVNKGHKGDFNCSCHIIVYKTFLVLVTRWCVVCAYQTITRRLCLVSSCKGRI